MELLLTLSHFLDKASGFARDATANLGAATSASDAAHANIGDLFASFSLLVRSLN